MEYKVVNRENGLVSSRESGKKLLNNDELRAKLWFCKCASQCVCVRVCANNEHSIIVQATIKFDSKNKLLEIVEA